MNYELAKKLKDAGFPQNGGLLYFASDKVGIRLNVVGFQNGDMKPPESATLVPTLSELIEACGDKFEYLKRYKADWIWEAGYFNEEAEGKTPEIAVANLWLALNKKV